MTDAALLALMKAIAAGDTDAARAMLKGSPGFARTRMLKGATRETARDYWFPAIGHYAYGGDTALHIAAAAYQLDLVKALFAAGADVRARNRRGAEPLHYASDGGPGTLNWNPKAQAAVIARLIAAGADPNALDDSGVAPIHRAVRTRCSAAVKALLDNGAGAKRKNKSGSTPMDLAVKTTGRGGSGSPGAKAEQAKIIRLLEAHAG
jgi:hypothetical protein